MRKIFMTRPNVVFGHYHIIPKNKKIINLISLCYNLNKNPIKTHGTFDTVIIESRK